MALNPLKILLTTWGSRGDFHPFLALGLELQKRGHTVALGANPYWEQETREAGLSFIATETWVSPEVVFEYPDILKHKKFGLRALDLFVNQFFAPQFDQTVEALTRVASDYDLMVAHHFVLAAPVVAQKSKIPWVTVTLAPGVMKSRYTAPAGANHSPLGTFIGEWLNSQIWELGERWCQKIVRKTMDAFYARHGLAPHPNYVFGSWSKECVLSLYSPFFAAPAKDYPQHFAQAGFCFKDSNTLTLPESVQDFLKKGEKPWLFTLGTVAIYTPENFYQEAIHAVEGTEERALLLIGRSENKPAHLPSNALAIDYLPHELIMPFCKGVVHQCGVGGVGQSLRAGIPSVACPFAFDQPNNAQRLRDLGVAVVLKRNQRKAANFRKAFLDLQKMNAFEKARKIGAKIRSENGVQRACEILENRPTAKHAKNR